MQVSIDDVLQIEIWDDDPVDPDDFLGILEIKIADEIVPARNCTIEKLFYLKDVPKDSKTKEVKKANVTIKAQWVPFDFNEEHDDKKGLRSHLHHHHDSNNS